MSEIQKLIHNPLRLIQLLSSKYSDITEELECLYLDCIIFNKSSHYLAIFKEIAYLDFTEEYLKRFYRNDESQERIPYLADYYKNYHMFFCQPVFCNWQLTTLIHNRCDTKAELFYKKNYGNIHDKPTEKHITNNDSLSSFDNVTNNKTIFDSNIRKRIDYNIATTMNFDNESTSQCINGSKLYTKRSLNDSLKNILNSLNVVKPQKEKMINIKRNKNSGLSLKSSLCTLIKNKGSAGTSLNEYDKFLLSPKLKPFISNYHSNLIDFNKGKQDKDKDKENKILTSSSNNQKYSVVVPNLSQKQIGLRNKKSNKTYDSKSLTKSKSKSKSKKFVFNGMHQPQNPNDVNLNCLLSNHHSKSKSQKSTISNNNNYNGKGFPSNSTYTNFILNTKSKRMAYVESQRSSSSKNTPFISHNIKTNSMNMCNNYCLSNSNIFVNSTKNSNTNVNNSRNNNSNNMPNGNKFHPNSLKKNNNSIQLQTNGSEKISRNKNNENNNRITTIRSKCSTNFQALTTFKASNSIEDKNTHCFELKTIIKGNTKENNHHNNNNNHQTIRFGTKLNDLLKTGNNLNWVNKPKHKDNNRNHYKFTGSNNTNTNILQLNTNNSPKILYPLKRNVPNEEGGKLFHPLTKATSQRKNKLNTPKITP